MTFLDIQNAVLSDRFAESQRTDIKNWVNSRYGRVWAQEPWSFKMVSVPVTLPANGNTLSLSTLGLQRVQNVWDSTFGSSNTDLYAQRPERFGDYTQTNSGYPVNYSVLGGNIVFDRPASSARAIVVIGESKWAPMSGDGEVPGLPNEFHFMLVHGAAAEGLRLQNDPTWQSFEDDFQRYLDDLRASYLTEVRTYGGAYPSWIPGF